MQKLHLWFARRRKNHTQTLRSKWLHYISTIQVAGPAVDGQQLSKPLKSNAVLAKPRNSQTNLQPWSVLGAKQAKPTGRKVSDVHVTEAVPITDSSMSGDVNSQSNSGSKRRTAPRRKELKRTESLKSKFNSR